MRRAARGEHSRPGAGTAGAACCPAARTGSRCPCAAPACTSIRAPPSSPRTPSTGRRHPRPRGCALPAEQRARQVPRRRLCPAAACSSLSQRRVGSAPLRLARVCRRPAGRPAQRSGGSRASGKLLLRTSFQRLLAPRRVARTAPERRDARPVAPLGVDERHEPFELLPRPRDPHRARQRQRQRGAGALGRSKRETVRRQKLAKLLHRFREGCRARDWYVCSG